MRRGTLMAALFLTMAPTLTAQDVRIGVLGIFHTPVLTLRAGGNQAVVIRTPERVIVLEPLSEPAAEIRVADGSLLLAYRGQSQRVSTLRASGRDNKAVEFILRVPGKISRMFRGKLEVAVGNGSLVSVVTMDLETAVASIVQAEADPAGPQEALKAQAVVTRSYLLTGANRHDGFDFCDLTHCQFLRQPPDPASPAGAATAATRGMVLSYREKYFTAMFTRSCAGKTRTPADLGMAAEGYPYFPVVCDYCHAEPRRWMRHVSAQDATQLLGRGESGRLSVVRRLGWDAVPSNDYVAHSEGGRVKLEGAGEGHGIGLCQRGAKTMATGGADFRKIIRRYFPNAEIVQVKNGNLR